ncbi:hypothetical protein [Sphingomonas sp. BAUL-RG-20F-R05-02]|uniref:hypothetical protein n=1 Tax=Sphingomonas sp. BAUL-RG-20F-R05-02 TaxID=2914830 RepID=UPI001F594175|nr:hypothetical protein [Sphingomonas sp. BAUL-RG-20F-R05-02]
MNDVPFSKQLPVNLEPSQRMAIEGLAIAAYLTKCNYEAIGVTVERAMRREGDLELSFDEKLVVFSSAWSIIDRVDALRQILWFQREYLSFKPTEAQLASIEIARQMRNAMDHPKGTIDKLISRKKEFPIYGVIGWTWFDETDAFKQGDGIILKGRKLSIISISGTHHPFSINTKEVLTDEVYFPWGNLNLWAFGKRLPLDDLITLSQNLLDHLDSVTADCTAEAIKHLGESYVPMHPSFCQTVQETFSAEHFVRVEEFQSL